MRSGGAAHKKIEAPRSIDGGDAQKLYSSHQSLVPPNPQSLIPSHSSLLSNLAYEAERPLIACERGGAGSIGSRGSKGLVRRIKK